MAPPTPDPSPSTSAPSESPTESPEASPSETPDASPSETPDAPPSEAPESPETEAPDSPKPTPEPDEPDDNYTEGFPDENTTGVPDGVDLEPSGSITVTKDNTVIDAVHVEGTIKVEAHNVTIKRSKITSTGKYAIHVEPGYKNLVVEDTEIDGNGTSKIAILFREYTLRRVNIHNFFDGIRIEGDNVLIEDSYVHHLYRVEGGHHDTIQMRQGSNVVIRNNNLQPYNPDTDDPMNAAIQFGSLLGPIDDVLVEGNLMNGGNVTVNAGKLGGGSVVFRDNRFGRDYRYGVLSRGPGLVWESSNVYDDTSKSAP